MKNQGLKKLLWFAIVFAMMLMMQVGVALGATLSSSDPATGVMGVPINKVITLTTDVVLTTTPSGITLDGGISLDVSLQSGKILCVPTTMLAGGKTYILTIPAGTLKVDPLDPLDLGNTAPITVTFKTAYNLADLIANLYTPETLNTLMGTKSPRGLNVNVPKKYLTKFEIAYSTNLTNPLTNVDITADAEVAKIMVQFGAATPIAAIQKGLIFNTGYEGSLTTVDATGKSIGQDIVFEAYDKYNRLLEKKETIKLNVKGNKLDYSGTKTLTATKTFADLILSNGKLFTNILKQYDVDELSLSVAN